MNTNIIVDNDLTPISAKITGKLRKTKIFGNLKFDENNFVFMRENIVRQSVQFQKVEELAFF